MNTPLKQVTTHKTHMKGLTYKSFLPFDSVFFAVKCEIFAKTFKGLHLFRSDSKFLIFSQLYSLITIIKCSRFFNSPQEIHRNHLNCWQFLNFYAKSLGISIDPYNFLLLLLENWHTVFVVFPKSFVVCKNIEYVI